MSGLFTPPKPPDCCLRCKMLGGETPDYGCQWDYIYYCLANVYFPTKKKTCKRMKLKEPPHAAD